MRESGRVQLPRGLQLSPLFSPLRVVSRVVWLWWCARWGVVVVVCALGLGRGLAIVLLTTSTVRCSSAVSVLRARRSRRDVRIRLCILRPLLRC